MLDESLFKNVRNGKIHTKRTCCAPGCKIAPGRRRPVYSDYSRTDFCKLCATVRI
jgi:hypothetical protein